jgi:hypothetical protein
MCKKFKIKRGKKKMNFKKILKLMAISTILVFTMIMIVVTPTLALSQDIGTQRVLVTDVKPHDGDVVTPIWTIDTTAPTTRLECKVGEQLVKCNDHWGNDNLSVTLKAFDSQSKTIKTFFALREVQEQTKSTGVDIQPRFREGTQFSLKEEGEFEVFFYSVDEAGNREATKKAIFKLDMTKPRSRIIDAPTTTQTKSFTIGFTGMDLLSGFDKVMVSVNGKAFEEKETLLISEKGTTTIQYFAVDIAGNEEDVRTMTFTIKTSGGNGGNGGGSSGGSVYVPTSYNLTDAQFQAGFSALLKEGQKILFKIDGKQFTLTLEDILSGAVKIDINSIDTFMTSRQSQAMDLTKDGINDFKITIGEVTSTTAMVTVKGYEGQIIVVDEDEEESDIVVVDTTDDESEEEASQDEEAKTLFSEVVSKFKETPLFVKLGFLAVLLLVGIILMITLRD